MEKLLKICSFLAKEYKKKTDKNITNLPLQKLLYYVQAVSLLKNDEAAFDEDIEAWRYGPVVPVAYEAFKNNKINLGTQTYNLLSEETKEIIKIVVDALGGKDPFLLVKITHTYDTWLNSWNNLDNKIISKEEIKGYHKKRIAEGKGAF